MGDEARTSRGRSADYVSWFGAERLSERIAALRTNRDLHDAAKHHTTVDDAALQRWKRRLDDVAEGAFSEFLSDMGASSAELDFILSRPAAVDREAQRPAWAAGFEEAYTSSGSPSRTSRAAETFAHVLRPEIDRARDRLLSRWPGDSVATEGGTLVDLSQLEGIFESGLAPRISQVIGRTMVLELHVARMKGSLAGNTTHDRFSRFIELLGNTDYALNLLGEYPALARASVDCIWNWTDALAEFVARLVEDWDEIRSRLLPALRRAELVEVDATRGDPHRAGRSVMIAKLDGGDRLVYKPRSVAVEAHFAQLLGWLNDRGQRPRLRSTEVLDCETHGWTAFVQPRDCGSTQDVTSFYERQGAHLALLYVLEATDFHYENLIADGEHPILVDLESLFHPRVHGGEESSSAAASAVDNSVLRVGLLPRKTGFGRARPGVDLSGLGGAGGQQMSFPVPVWESVGTDEMHLDRVPAMTHSAENLPRLEGHAVELGDYSDALARGFEATYRLIMRHRQSLEGRLVQFVDDEVRVILRPTSSYATLLRESYHPSLMTDAVTRDEHFSVLWTRSDDAAHRRRFALHELRDLHRGDIPIFVARPGSRSVWASDGVEIEGVFPETGLAAVRRRLGLLSEADMERQLWFLRASIACMKTGPSEKINVQHTMEPGYKPVEAVELYSRAQDVGDRLAALAHRGKDVGVQWLGLHLTDEDNWSIAPCGVDLYDGLPGIALFFGYLGATTGQARFTELARGALVTLDQHVGHGGLDDLTATGAFDGLGGVIYALSHLAALWDDRDLLGKAESLCARLPDLIGSDKSVDIMSGTAGCLMSLLSLHAVRPSPGILSLAIDCGNRLARYAIALTGSARGAPADGGQPLSGFSHGAAGVAWSLVRLADVTGRKEYRSAALLAVEYEDTLFSPTARNWLDLRPYPEDGGEPDGSPPNQRYITAWCHGAPGIGLSRTGMLDGTSARRVGLKIDAAIRTTQERGFGSNHSICHGDLGNLEALTLMNMQLQSKELERHITLVTRAILDDVDRHGYRCGLPLEVEAPGLMTGLAGIGYGLLRLASPERIPPVLVLAPPMVTSSSATAW